jgi:putative DNA primase/helicase
MNILDLSPEEYLQEVGERLGLFAGPEFLALPLPERKPILGPWLVEQSLTMLCAEAGLGKTRFLLGMALAVAKGEPFLDYPAGPPQPVLYIDGEMPARELQDRLNSLGKGDVPKNVYLLSGAKAFDPWLDFNDDFARFQVEEAVIKLKPKVVIFDNKSTLIPPMKENDAESWVEIQRWFIKLRERGLAVVLVHHTGKNGLQRGSSMHEVVLDTSIMLKKPLDGVRPLDGLRFVLTFTKHRHFYGKDAEAKLVTLSNQEGQGVWAVGSVPEANQKAQQARELSATGMTQREIAETIGVSVGSVNTYLKAA